jgi:hypothetical protein
MESAPLLAVALAVLVVLPAAGAVAAAPDDARLTVTGVSVSPASPTVDEPTTFSVALRNSVGSSSAVELDAVVLRTESGDRLARETDLGTLSGGDTLTVPVTATFDSAGRKALTVVAVGTDDDGETVRVTRPVSIAVVTPENAPDDARLTVTGVSATPETPVPGDPVTLSVDLRSSAGGPSPVALDHVAVRTAGGETLANATDPGTLSGGETLAVPLTTAFDAAGRKDLTVVAAGTAADGTPSRVERPLSLVVEQAPPLLEATVRSPVANAPSTVAVAVSNPTTAPVRNLVVTVDGDGVAESRRTLADLAAGERAVLNVSTVPTEPGETRLNVSLAYTTAADVRARTSIERTVTVAPADRDLGVRVGTVEETEQQAPAGQLQGILGGGVTQQEDDTERPGQVAVTVTNFGNAPARQVVLSPSIGDRQLPRQVVAATIPRGGEASVTVDLSGVRRSGAVEFSVRGRMAGGNATGATAYDYRPAVGAVRLTGIDLSFRQDGTLQVSGNAGNTGGAPVDGVVVSVGSNEHVDPAYPARTYFVGTVDASEFAPFEVTADVDVENVSTVPVTVEYRVGGEPVNRTLSVPYEAGLRPDRGGGGGGIGLPVLAVAVVALAAIALVGIRRFRG